MQTSDMNNSNTSKHSHKLLVRVIEARDLPRADIVSKSDPFVKLKVTGWHRARKTSYQSNTSEPLWNQEMIVRAYRAKDKLRLKVYDHDHLSKNDLLGFADIPLSKYMLNEGQIFNEWIPLVKKRKILGGYKPTQGQVHLQMMYGVKKH